MRRETLVAFNRGWFPPHTVPQRVSHYDLLLLNGNRSPIPTLILTSTLTQSRKSQLYPFNPQSPHHPATTYHPRHQVYFPTLTTAGGQVVGIHPVDEPPAW